jgi:hypothetical protein
MSMKKKSVTTFLNVDLDLRAPSGVEEFLTSIASSVVVLHQARHEASVELRNNFPSLEETVVGFVGLIDSLPPQARIIWDELESRKLDVGIQAGSEPHAVSFTLSSKTISSLARARLEIIFTVYAPP